MKYTLENGKIVIIPDSEIKKNMDLLGISEQESIEMWLDDNDYTINEEQQNLEKIAKNIKIDVGCDQKTRKKSDKPREKKVSDEKKELFSEILSDLEDVYKGNVTVLNENKLISVKIGEKTFKIDVIETRTKKS